MLLARPQPSLPWGWVWGWVVVLIAGLLTSGSFVASVEAQEPKGPKPNFKIYHVQADRAEEAELPKELKPFEKQLKVLGNQFKLLSKPKSIHLAVDKPSKIPLPKKLGEAQILNNADKSVSLVLISVKDPKKPLQTKHRRFPIFALTPAESFTLPQGKYLLIVEKLEEKK